MSSITIKKLLIANRGEIARRIIRTARKMGIATVAVYSDADAKALHVRDADETVHIGASPATESYLIIDKIIAAAKQTGADAIHPGYGFLSENADLRDACAKAGISFVGPRAEAMRALGGKAAAKDIAIKAGVPVVPGYQGRAQDLATLMKEAKRIGYPVMIKAVAGGGGRGMRLVERDAEFAELFDSAKREATSAFGNPDVLIEKVVIKPRHIEVQVFGDTKGNVVHLFERDCTLQRRNQKVIEEAPAPGMSEALRAKMCEAAVKLAKSVNYEGAGTVEFLVEGGALSADAPWYFIEMNTRLQVEHPVTEEITGLDLVEWQLRIAAGEQLPLAQKDIAMSGHAIEVRLCAEDPSKGFMPSVGKIEHIEHRLVAGRRLEIGVEGGDIISPFYDSMIAKLIVRDLDRDQARSALVAFLNQTHVVGLNTNARFLRSLLIDADVAANRMDTGLIARKIGGLAEKTMSQAAFEKGVRRLRGASVRAAESDLDSPWAVSDGFCLGPARPVAMPVLIEGAQHVAVVTPGTSRAGGIGVFNAAIALSGRTLTLDDKRAGAVDAYSYADCVFVIDDLNHFQFQRPVYDTAAIEDAGDGSAIRAPINGRVAKIFAKTGDAVEKGQRIAVVEAMKMEHVLSAAAAGTIEKIAVPEGAQVVLGALIASLAVAKA